MEKKCNVHLLDTEPTSQLALHDRLGLITAKSQGWNYIRKWDYIQPKHLYFTSDEEPGVGDFAINTYGTNNTIFKVTEVLVDGYTGQKLGKENVFYGLGKTLRKIVATTNTELQVLIPDGQYLIGKLIGCSKALPRIGDDFVEVYIEEYEEGKPITEVNLEYEKWFDFSDRLSRQSVGEDGCVTNAERIKLRSDGAVIANPVVAEKLLTRAEALAMLEDYDRELKLDTFAYKEAPTFTVESWFNNKYKI